MTKKSKWKPTKRSRLTKTEFQSQRPALPAQAGCGCASCRIVTVTCAQAAALRVFTDRTFLRVPGRLVWVVRRMGPSEKPTSHQCSNDPASFKRTTSRGDFSDVADA